MTILSRTTSIYMITNFKKIHITFPMDILMSKMLIRQYEGTFIIDGDVAKFDEKKMNIPNQNEFLFISNSYKGEELV